MTLLLIAIAGWLTVAVVVSPLVWGLSRAAAIGDRDQREQVDLAHAVEADRLMPDRRDGAADRRATGRPWAVEAPGRRTDDVLRRERAEAHRALRDAEARLAEIEARRSA